MKCLPPRRAKFVKTKYGVGKLMQHLIISVGEHEERMENCIKR